MLLATFGPDNFVYQRKGLIQKKTTKTEDFVQCVGKTDGKEFQKKSRQRLIFPITALKS